MSLEDYQELLDRQGGKCAICKSDRYRMRGSRLAVDHDHKTGHVRGLLCGECNVAIGKLKDDTELLRRALIYLEGGEFTWL